MGNWLLTVTIVLWIAAVVALALGAVVPKVSFDGPPTVYQRHHAAPHELALAVVLVGIPVAATVLAAITRHQVTVLVLLVLTALLVVPAVYIGQTGVRDRRAGRDATLAPTTTRCVPRSGSTHGCPGG